MNIDNRSRLSSLEEEIAISKALENERHQHTLCPELSSPFAVGMKKLAQRFESKKNESKNCHVELNLRNIIISQSLFVKFLISFILKSL